MSAPTTTTTTTTPLSPTAPTPAEARNAAFERLVEKLLATIAPYLSRENLEVEWRLCTFAGLPVQAPPPHPARQDVPGASAVPRTAPAVVPRILESRHKITVGVAEADFALMEAHVKKSVVDDAHPLLSTCTEDVQDGSHRITYNVADDGTKARTISINKKRLCVVDMALPGSPYDLRLSVNTEMEEKTPAQTPSSDAPDTPPAGKNLFSRLKRRQSVACDEAKVRYDLTRVVTSNKYTSFEVELEGSFSEPATELTSAWVRSALERMVTLATLKEVQGTRVELVVHERMKRPR